MSVKLTIDEVLQLEAEINGLTNQQTGEVVYKNMEEVLKIEGVTPHIYGKK